MEKLARSKNTPGTDAAFDLSVVSLSMPRPMSATQTKRCSSQPILPTPRSWCLGRLRNGSRSQSSFPMGWMSSGDPLLPRGPVLLLSICLLWLADHIRRKRNRPTFVPRERW